MDDELEEHCDACGPGGTKCTMPSGHPGNTHHFEIELPPHVGQLIAQHVDALEAAERAHKRASRWLLGAIIVNLAAAVWNVIGILT